MTEHCDGAAEERRGKAERGRIEEGGWGWCVTCGEAIAEGRLRNDPSVATCVGCAG